IARPRTVRHGGRNGAAVERGDDGRRRGRPRHRAVGWTLSHGQAAAARAEQRAGGGRAARDSGDGARRDRQRRDPHASRGVARLERGVYLNCGSAVLLPEVFLKAVALARNRGSALAGLTTVNLDFVRSYRPQTNVVSRPTAGTGRGYSLVGHHEIMIPLLAA